MTHAARILAIDDSPAMLGLFNDMLAGSGRSVEVMQEPPARLEPIKSMAPDVILLDLAFGGTSVEGWALLQRLRTDPDTEGVPVVVCTALADEVEGQRRWLARHRVLVVVKPFEISALEEAIEEAAALS